MTCPAYGCTVAYTGQVIFYKVQNRATRPCFSGRVVYKEREDGVREGIRGAMVRDEHIVEEGLKNYERLECGI